MALTGGDPAPAEAGSSGTEELWAVQEPAFPFHPSRDVRNDAGCAEGERKNNKKMGKAASVKHLSAVWFSERELGELWIRQP